MPENNCAVCGDRLRRPTSLPDPNDPSRTLFDCSRCGQYTMSQQLTYSSKLAEIDKGKLSGIIRHGADASQHNQYSEYITRDNVKLLVESSGAPTTVDEQIEVLIRCIAARAPNYAQMTPVEGVGVWAARAYMLETGLFQKFVSDVQESSEPVWQCKKGTDGTMKLRLTLVGWRKLRELKQTKGTGRQCFVAMWFHPRMFEIFDQAIKPAIEEEGFSPYLVGTDQHDERIDNRILSQIRKSRFMIADFTGLRGGVYYEAGFAEGLGIPVLWSCNESWNTVHFSQEAEMATVDNCAEFVSVAPWRDKIHFDIRQLPFIFWSDGEEFKGKIRDWIGARRHLFDANVS